MVKKPKGIYLDFLPRCLSKSLVLQNLVMRGLEVLHRCGLMARVNGNDWGGELIGTEAQLIGTEAQSSEEKPVMIRSV